jgi:hypothetical protein
MFKVGNLPRNKAVVEEVNDAVKKVQRPVAVMKRSSSGQNEVSCKKLVRGFTVFLCLLILLCCLRRAQLLDIYLGDNAERCGADQDDAR